MNNVSNLKLKKFDVFIDGEFISPDSGDYFLTHNPYTGEAWAQVARGTEVDVNRAVMVAQRAGREGPWARMLPEKRAQLINCLADTIADNAEELAQWEIRDNGKAIREVRPQVQGIPALYRYFSGIADKIEGKTIPVDPENLLVYTINEPIGVVAAITPWNSPLRLLSLKLAPALAAGATMVVKPSEFTSTSTLRFVELLTEAGLPNGVVNVITGFGEETGAPLARHPEVAKISLTGGGEAGARAYQAASNNIANVSLELGGKSANIIFPDANIEKAIDGATAGVFGSGGQTCVAGSRLLVHKDIKDQVVAGLKERALSIRQGDPSLLETEMGPVANRAQYDKIMHYIKLALEEGATLVCGGRRAEGPGLGNGLFVEPTVFMDVTADMKIAQDEIFGPVLSIMEYSDEEEAVELANSLPYGLAGALWTKDLSRAHRIAKKLQTGTVWVNGYRQNHPSVPVGGYRLSGVGKEAGWEMVKEYLNQKSIWINL